MALNFNKMKKLFLGFLTLCLYGGCEKILPYKLPYDGDKLVINGQIDATQVVSVNITHSVAPTGTHAQDLSVANANVQLWENGQYLQQLVHSQTGNYLSSSNFMPKKGNNYQIKVSASGFPDAESSIETIPNMPTVLQYDFQDSVLESPNAILAGKLSVNLKDNIGENFYRVFLEGEKDGKTQNMGYFWLVNGTINNPERCGFLPTSYSSFSFSDICVENQEFEIQIGIETQGIDSAGFPVFLDKIKVHIQQVSAAYYEYNKSIIQPEGLENAFAEGTSLFTNITGGYGIWATSHTKTIIIIP